MQILWLNDHLFTLIDKTSSMQYYPKFKKLVQNKKVGTYVMMKYVQLATKLREKSLTIQYCIEKGIDIAELLKTT